MPVSPVLERIGWPSFAVERIECATCGRMSYMETSAPSRGSHSYDSWVREAWSFARSMQTRFGFMLWCSAQCETGWMRANSRRLKYSHHAVTAENVHRREMERRAIATGEFQR